MLEARLIVKAGKHEGKVLSLPRGRFIVGREKDCHLRPASELISRHHCVFHCDGYVARLRDLGSRNGTVVNGNRLNGETELSTGDEVVIGPLEFRVELRESEADATGSTSISSLSDSGVLTSSETAYELQVAPLREAPATPHQAAPAPESVPPASPPIPGYPPGVNPQQGQPMPQYPGYPGGMPYYPQYPPGYPMYPYPMPGYPQHAGAPQQPPQPNAKSSENKIVAPPVKLPPPPE